LRTRSDAKNKTVTDASWKDDWYIRDYPRKSPGAPSIPVDFIPERVYISEWYLEKKNSLSSYEIKPNPLLTANSNDSSTYYSTYLTLSTQRLSPTVQEAGEITFSEFNASYASIRVFCRVHGSPGGVAGIFTYLNDTEESDIELFTRAPSNYIQYSNQPTSSGDPDWTPIVGATVNDTLPNNTKYTDWHVHRLDWTLGRSVFFVDDVQTNTTILNVPAALPPSGIYIDMWSANSTWSGSILQGQSAELDVQWVELLFNATVVADGNKLPAGANICPVGAIDQDAVKQVSGGKPGIGSGQGWRVLDFLTLLVTGVFCF
jgi:hypothetical protein